MDKRKIKSQARLQQALKTLLASRDLRKITIEDLCNEAGVTRPTFYSNYRDLPDMLDQHLAQVLESLETIHDVVSKEYERPDEPQRIVHLLTTTLDMLDRDDPRLQVLFSDSPVIFPDQRFSELVLKLIENNGSSTVKKMSAAERLIIAHYFTGAILGVIRLWMQKPADVSSAQIAKTFSDMTPTGQ